MDAPLDLRGLPPPEPMERILDRIGILQPGERFTAVLPHYPAPLIPLLQAQGADFHTETREDGALLLTVWLAE